MDGLSEMCEEYFDASTYRLPLCAEASRTKLCAGRASPIPALHFGPDQPNPDLTLTQAPALLGGSRSAGSVTRLRRVCWWRFPSKRRVAERFALMRPASCTKCRAGRSCTYCRSSPKYRAFRARFAAPSPWHPASFCCYCDARRKPCYTSSR